MRRLLLLVAASLITVLVSAQCTPDTTLRKPGLKPDRLPDGIVGTAYSTTITLFVPLDTSIVWNGTTYNAKIDSATVVELTHLPNGFSYICDNPRRTWGGGKRGCAKLMGNPAASDTGDYVIRVKVRTFFKIVGLPSQLDQLDSSTVDLKIKMPSALQELQQQAGMQVYPNPAKGELIVEAEHYSANNHYQVYNLMGQNMDLTPEYSSNTGRVIFHVESLPAGVYVVRSESDGHTWQTRFVKE